MHTTIAYSKGINLDTGIFTKIEGVPDQHIKVHGTMIYIASFNHLIGVYCIGGTLPEEARLVSPSLRRVNPFYITPLEVGLLPVEPIAMRYFPDSPVRLETNEALEAEISGADAAASVKLIVCFLAPGAVVPVSGEIWTINTHVKVELKASVWQYCEIDFPDTLPVATYSVVGARMVAGKGAAFRFVPVGEPYRPGGIVVQDVDENDPDRQRFGALGRWFDFPSIQPPGIEVIACSAEVEATYELYLDVIKR